MTTPVNVTSGQLTITVADAEAVSRTVDDLTLTAGHAEHRAWARDAVPDVGFRSLLAAVDDSAASAHVAAWARALSDAFGAGRPSRTADRDGSSGAVVDVAFVHVADGRGGPARADAVLDRAVAAFHESGEGTPRGRVESTLREGDAAEEIVGLALDARFDLVILGSRGLGFLERALGLSVSEDVRTRAPVSVLLARDAPPPDGVVVGVDGLPPSKVNTLTALVLARHVRAPLTLVHALAPRRGDPVDRDRVETERRLKHVTLPDARTTPLIRVGDPGDALLDSARDHAHPLVVMGSRGVHGWRALLTGDVSRRVAHAHRGSILLVHAPARAGP